MVDDEFDEFFDDDGTLDALQPDELNALEQEAFQSTQSQAALAGPPVLNPPFRQQLQQTAPQNQRGHQLTHENVPHSRNQLQHRVNPGNRPSGYVSYSEQKRNQQQGLKPLPQPSRPPVQAPPQPRPQPRPQPPVQPPVQPPARASVRAPISVPVQRPPLQPPPRDQHHNPNRPPQNQPYQNHKPQPQLRKSPYGQSNYSPTIRDTPTTEPRNVGSTNTILPTANHLATEVIVPKDEYDDFEDEFSEAAELWGVVGPTIEQSYVPIPAALGTAEAINRNALQGLAAQHGGAYEAQMQLNNPQQNVAREASALIVGQRNMQVQGADEPMVTDLETLVGELQFDNDKLRKDLERVKAAEMAKSGEASIIRTKLMKTERDHASMVQQEKMNNAEERRKNREEVERLKSELGRKETEMAFLKKEMDELVKSNKILDKERKYDSPRRISRGPDVIMGGTPEAEMQARGRPLTPKRTSYPYGDGFDDSQILPTSPLKHGRLKTPPKPGTKRKRANVDSPVPQPAISRSRIDLADPVPVSGVDDKILEGLLNGWENRHYHEFTEQIMLCKLPGADERCISALTHFNFPSLPGTTLSDYFVNKFTILDTISDVCKLLISMWKRCCEEKFYDALPLVLEMIRLCILESSGSICIEIMDDAMTLAMETIYINSMPVVQKLNTYEAGADGTICLTIMEEIALAAKAEEQHITRFWKLVSSEFTLMMLNINQPMEHLQQMVSILCTSVMSKTFGTISSSEDRQRQNEEQLLLQVTQLLVLAPKQMNKARVTVVDSEEEQQRCIEPGTKNQFKEITKLRIGVIQFLGCMSLEEASLLALCHHPSVLERLVICINKEIDHLYEWRRGDEARSELINAAVRILAAMYRAHPDVCIPKLKDSSPSFYKHTVAMTRLAFSERAGQESLLEEDACEAAGKLLELICLPDEIEELYSLFTSK